MALKRGGIGVFLVKWVVIPVGLAALGFFVIGPRIGAKIDPPKTVEITQQPEDPATTPAKRFNGEPKIEIEAQPISRRRERTRTRPSSSTEESAPPVRVSEPEPPVDPEPSNPEPTDPTPTDGAGDPGTEG